jgi:mycothiol synthase
VAGPVVVRGVETRLTTRTPQEDGGRMSLRLEQFRFDDGVVDGDQLATAASLYDAFETSRVGRTLTSAAELRKYVQLPTVVHAGTGLLRDGDEAVALVFGSAEPHGRNVYGDLAVVPGAGETRLLEECVDRIVAASADHVAALGQDGWRVRLGAFRGDPVLHDVLRSRGFEEARVFWRMSVDTGSPAVPAEAPPLPPGVELVVRDDEETRRAIWHVDEDSFVDHYNFTPTPYEDWWEHVSSGDVRDPDGWWLLTVDGEPAAMCLLDERRAELGEGYVNVLGVRKEFRGRGLGSWLLQRAFVRYREMGRTAVHLDVDSENTTGAVAVYERVGMTPVVVNHGYVRALS